LADTNHSGEDTMNAMILVRAAAALMVAWPLSASVAQDAANYPSRAVTIVAPAAPGGGSDTVARLLARELQAELGGSWVVENRPGAGSITGVDYVARQPGDGYTMVTASTTSHGIPSAMMRDLPFDPIKSFSPISLIEVHPAMLVINPKKIPNVKTIPELVEFLKRNPGRITYGTSGLATPQNMYVRMFMMMTGTNMIMVPYNGSGPMVTDLIAGNIDMAIETIQSVQPHVETGTLLALGTTYKEPFFLTPNVPPIAQYLPGYHAGSWIGIFAAANTPDPIVRKLSAAFAKIVRKPDVDRTLRGMGFLPVGSTPEELAALVKQELETWAKVVEATGGCGC
jgi:tripartite-type tricarboxylate transporter receptor subunit TctC